MSYSDFTLRDIKKQFGISNKFKTLFDTVTPLEVSKDLEEAIKLSKTLPMKSEKARSELIVMPILIDLMTRNEQFFTIYSGEVLNADKEKGLIGACDFILAHNTRAYEINTPILIIVEQAKNHDTEIDILQCATQMVGAKYYNDKAKKNTDTIYGCVTTVNQWIFLKLQDNQIIIDNKTYYFNQMKKVLGIFQMIIDYYKKTLK